MILDLARFAAQREGEWTRLERLLDRVETRPARDLTIEEVEDLETLYQRAASDLCRLAAGTPPGEVRTRLEATVARAYGQIYSSPRVVAKQTPRQAAHRGARAFAWFLGHFAVVFRRHGGAALLSLALTLAGVALGGAAVHYDPAAVHVLLPAGYLSNPAARVAREYAGAGQHQPNASQETAFSAQLITHNISVVLLAAGLGLTWGLGTGVLLFSNGVLLGAVAVRYASLGFGGFVAAWLLPHGAFEIPSVLIGGQAGFMLAQMLLKGKREIADFLTLLGGCALLLVWAGTMEAFVSQHHAPGAGELAPIVAGIAELIGLGAWLAFAGKDDARV